MFSGLNDQDEDLLAEYLLDWEDSQRSSSPMTAEQICNQRGDLVAELKRRIAKLDMINRLVFDPDHETGVDDRGSVASFQNQSCPDLPGYEVFEEIGRGGMGVVFKAKQKRLNRFVAIKTIRGGRYVSKQEIARFKVEAEILGQLHHPRIVQIYDVLESDGILCLVLEFVNGTSLAKASRETTTAPLQAAQLAREITDAVAAVHAKGILHRDIKPGNILIDTDGAIKVTDFGVAKVLITESSTSITGTVLGSPSYMAPEQALGNTRQISERTDIYGIGATLYELLTARPPFAGSSFLDTLSQVGEQDPTPPKQLVSSIPADLQTICLKCLEKDPTRRYASAKLLGEDLDRFLKGIPIVARPVSSVEHGIRWCRRNPDRAGLGFFAILSGIIIAIGTTWFTARLSDAKRLADSQATAIKAEKAASVTQEFFARYGRIRERGLSRPNGWLKTNLAEINDLAAIADNVERKQLLRTEAFRCVYSYDVREVATLLTNVDISCMAHHPTQPILAAGDNRSNGVSVTIHLVDMKTRAKFKSLTFPISAQFALLNRGGDGVRSIAFTPSGNKLVVGSRSGWIYVWDTITWKQVDHWQAASEWVTGMAIDSAGRTVYTGSMGGEIKQWQLSDHRLLNQASVTGELYGLCLTNNHLVVSGDTCALLLRSDLTPQVVSEPWIHGARTVAAGAARSTVFIGRGNHLTQIEIDFEPPIEFRELVDPRLHQAHRSGLDFIDSDSSGRFLVSTDSSSVKLWDAVAGKLIATVNPGAASAKTTTFVPDGSHFATGGDDHVTLYEIDKNPSWNVYPRDSGPVFDASLSTSGQVLAQFMERHSFNGSTFCIAHFKNLVSGVVHEYGLHSSTDDEIAIAGNDNWVIATDRQNCRVVELNAVKDSPRREIACGPNARLLTVSRGGPSFYFVADDVAAIGVAKPPSALFVCELETGQPSLLWSNLDSQRRLSKSKILAIGVGTKWLATASFDGNIRIHKASDGSVVTSLPFNTYVTSLAVSDDDWFLLAGDGTGSIRVLELPSGDVLSTSENHHDEISGLAICKNGLIASACSGGEIRFWKFDHKTKSLELLATLGPLGGPIKRLAFSNDAKTLVVLIDGESAARIMRLNAVRDALGNLGLDW